LLDRAEEVLLKLRGTQFERRLPNFLLEIYEQEKDWLKAIQVARQTTDAAAMRAPRRSPTSTASWRSPR